MTNKDLALIARKLNNIAVNLKSSSTINYNNQLCYLLKVGGIDSISDALNEISDSLINEIDGEVTLSDKK